jgi:putative acyl-CoA dehydrogenase
MVMRLAAAFDGRASDEGERSFCRVATAVSKFWLCKRAPVHVGEALECLGGNGYVEDSGMPRLYREAPLYGIWEGSGNVICLDILRALGKEPAALEALVEELRSSQGRDARFDAYVAETVAQLGRELKRNLNNGAGETEGQARRLAERLALALQASLVLKHSSSELVDAMIASRLSGDHGQTFGTLPAGVDLKTIIEPVIRGLEQGAERLA